MYYVTPPPADPREFQRWVFEQFRRIQEQMSDSTEYARFGNTTVAPQNPRAGDVRYIDGNNWNPGFDGPALIVYNGTSWEVLGGAKRWDDLQFPSYAVTAPGIQDPDYDVNTASYLFDQNLREVLLYSTQLPHAIAEPASAGDVTKAISPHVHWFKTVSATGSVVWVLDYKWAKLGEKIGDWASITAVGVVAGTPDFGSASKQFLTSFPDITLSSQQISDVLIMKLQRVGATAADTYSADVGLLYFDIHIQKDSEGSVALYSKT